MSNKLKIGDEYKKLELTKSKRFYYIYLPLILAIIALVFSILDIEVQMTAKDGMKNEFKFYTGITEVFHSDRYISNNVATSGVGEIDGLIDGNEVVASASLDENDGLIGDPNVISIIASLSMIACVVIVPKSMLKVRKSGDGLGIMFLPLGLMCINNVMCSLIYDKDIVFCAIFSAACFIVSALATFKKSVKYVEISCYVLILTAIFLFLAKLSPYCYNQVVAYDVVDNQLSMWPVYQYYISFFIRDILTFASFGIFASFISKTYKINE